MDQHNYFALCCMCAFVNYATHFYTFAHITKPRGRGCSDHRPTPYQQQRRPLSSCLPASVICKYLFRRLFVISAHRTSRRWCWWWWFRWNINKHKSGQCRFTASQLVQPKALFPALYLWGAFLGLVRWNDDGWWCTEDAIIQIITLAACERKKWPLPQVRRVREEK